MNRYIVADGPGSTGNEAELHAGCEAVDYPASGAHTHMGARGWWLFASEATMPGSEHPEDEFEPSVSPRIYGKSIPVGEHKQLRDAIDRAVQASEVTWVRDASGKPVAAIVPLSVAQAGLKPAGGGESTVLS